VDGCSTDTGPNSSSATCWCSPGDEGEDDVGDANDLVGVGVNVTIGAPSSNLHAMPWQYPLLRCTISAGVKGEADVKGKNDMTMSKKARRNDCARMVDLKGGIGNWNEKTREKRKEKVVAKGP